MEQACHAGGHRSPKAPEIRPDIVGRWVIAPIHALCCLFYKQATSRGYETGYIGLSTRGHARARELRDKRQDFGDQRLRLADSTLRDRKCLQTTCLRFRCWRKGDHLLR